MLCSGGVHAGSGGAVYLANSGCRLESYLLNVASLFKGLLLLLIKGHKSEPKVGQICRKALPAHAPTAHIVLDVERG